MQIPLACAGGGTTQGTGNMESTHKSYLSGKVYGSSEYSRGDGCQVFLHNRGSFVSALPLGSSPHATAGNFLSILRRAAGLEQGSSPTFLFRLCFLMLSLVLSRISLCMFGVPELLWRKLSLKSPFHSAEFLTCLLKKKPQQQKAQV